MRALAGVYVVCVSVCFLSSHSRLIRNNAVGENPLCIWSHHSDFCWCFSSQIKQHTHCHVCLPNMSQGWWSYVHYQTARPHLPHDTFSLSRSLALFFFSRLQQTNSLLQTESFSASQLSLHPTLRFHHSFCCHQSKLGCQREREKSWMMSKLAN